jgi:hypothetical protein
MNALNALNERHSLGDRGLPKLPVKQGNIEVHDRSNPDARHHNDAGGADDHHTNSRLSASCVMPRMQNNAARAVSRSTDAIRVTVSTPSR